MNVKNLVRPWLHSLEPYPPGKPIDELEREYGVSDSIKLASNENPLGPSPRALAALQAALGDVHRYPDGSCYHLRRALARKLRVSPDSLVFGNGSNEIIELVVRTFLHAGEEAVMADQAFVIYRMLVQAQGGRAITVPLRNFTHDLEAMADAITPATRLVFLANPNNPTGTIVFREQWQEFLSAVPRDVVIVMDEAYFEYVTMPGYETMIPLAVANPRVVVARTFSKCYGMAGLRIGYAVGHKDAIAKMSAWDNIDPLSVMAIAGAKAALAVPASWVDAEKRRNADARAFTMRWFADRGFTPTDSQTNFIFVDIKRPAKEFRDACARAGVLVGRDFPPYEKTHARISIGTLAEMQRAVGVFASALGVPARAA